MALGGFNRSRGMGASGSESQAAGASPAGGITAYIDPGSQFEGKLNFKDTVRIDGHFVGEITSENTLVVGETGEVHASVRSKVVVVSGTIVGDVHASRQLVLHKTARVEGDVETSSLVVEDGAVICGQVTMSRPATESSGTVLRALDRDASC